VHEQLPRHSASQPPRVRFLTNTGVAGVLHARQGRELVAVRSRGVASERLLPRAPSPGAAAALGLGLEPLRAPACTADGLQLHAVAVAVGAAGSVPAASGAGVRAQERPRRRVAVQQTELVLACVGHPGAQAGGPVGEGVREGDLVPVCHDRRQDHGRAGVAARLVRGHRPAVPRRAAPGQVGPAPDEVLEARAEVPAQGEIAGGRVLGALPGDQPPGEACPVVRPERHPGEDGVSRVVEALPQDGAVRGPEDQVLLVEQHGAGPPSYRNVLRAPVDAAAGGVRQDEAAGQVCCCHRERSGW